MIFYIYWKVSSLVDPTSWFTLWNETLPVLIWESIFERLFWDWYRWWAIWIVSEIWTWLAPVGSDIYTWPSVHCGHTTCIKCKLPWLGGISFAIYNCVASFKILSKVFDTYLWDMHDLSLTIHTCCNSLWGVDNSSLSVCAHLALTQVQMR